MLLNVEHGFGKGLVQHSGMNSSEPEMPSCPVPPTSGTAGRIPAALAGVFPTCPLCQDLVKVLGQPGLGDAGTQGTGMTQIQPGLEAPGALSARGKEQLRAELKWVSVAVPGALSLTARPLSPPRAAGRTRSCVWKLSAELPSPELTKLLAN